MQGTPCSRPNLYNAGVACFGEHGQTCAAKASPKAEHILCQSFSQWAAARTISIYISPPRPSYGLLKFILHPKLLMSLAPLIASTALVTHCQILAHTFLRKECPQQRINNDNPDLLPAPVRLWQEKGGPVGLELIFDEADGNIGSTTIPAGLSPHPGL